MKTQLSKPYLRKNMILFFMPVLMISLLVAKLGWAQDTLWAENKETHQRNYFTLNKSLSYKLITSRNFHNRRLTSFTDSTLTIQINGKGICQYQVQRP